MKDLSKEDLKSKWEELGRLEKQLAQLANMEKEQEEVFCALIHADSGQEVSLGLQPPQSFYQN